MRLSFDSIEEVREFVKGLKGTRGGKGGDTDDAPAAGAAPAPMAPPAGGQASTGFPGSGFAPPAAGAAPMGGGFPVAAAPGMAPEVQALVTRIVTKLDAAIAGGQPADAAVAWFRGQCGPETANYSLDQIKQHALPKLSVPALENVAKMMGA